METFTTNSEDIKSAIKLILHYIGENPERDGLKDTPDRVLKMFKEIFKGYDNRLKPKITTFKNELYSEEMIFDKGDYYSICEHHILPFFGTYYFAYIPSKKGKLLGISKIARVVNYCSSKLQLQERLAKEIITMLSEALDNKVQGFAIMMKGTHTCKSMRGVKDKGEMTVSYFTGIFKNDPQKQNEFFQIINLNKI